MKRILVHQGQRRTYERNLRRLDDELKKLESEESARSDAKERLLHLRDAHISILDVGFGIKQKRRVKSDLYGKIDAVLRRKERPMRAEEIRVELGDVSIGAIRTTLYRHFNKVGRGMFAVDKDPNSEN